MKTMSARAARLAGLLLVLASRAAVAETPPPVSAPQVQAKALDNYTIQRLIVLNDKDEVLLERNPVGWMTPAVRSRERQSIKEALDSMTSSLGITVEQASLSGVFTYKFKETPPDPEHAPISFRTHYSARYKSGKVIQPADPGKEYKWVPIDEIPKRITMDSLRSETMQILRHPDVVWGGSFLVVFEDGQMKSSESLEEPYALAPSHRAPVAARRP